MKSTPIKHSLVLAIVIDSNINYFKVLERLTALFSVAFVWGYRFVLSIVRAYITHC